MDHDIVKKIKDFTETSPLNTAEAIGLGSIFQIPIVAFANAKDPLFYRLKEADVIGPDHLSPREFLPEAETVVSYFLPFSAEVRSANREQGFPAKEWLYGRVEGEAFNNALRDYLVEEMGKEGIKALAPTRDPRYSVKYKKSNWSERHIAFIAGLGSFGLNKSLITEKGCAGRFGSVAISEEIKPSSCSDQDIYQYCNRCYACIARCPARAITEKGKDVNKCSSYLSEEIRPRFMPRYGCGKCQTGVPCEASFPG